MYNVATGRIRASACGKVENMPRKIPPVNTNDLIKSYLAGESQNSIAKRIGVSRDAIRRIIVSNGVKVRGNADANRLMMTHRTPEENATNTTAAHTAVRGVKRNPEELISRAITRQSKMIYVGMHESEFMQELISRGHSCVPQMAVERYNIDIAISPFAFEIHSQTILPHKSTRHGNTAQRIKYLADHGWTSIYALTAGKVTPNKIRDMVNQLESIMENASRNPTKRSEYWVIRRNGKSSLLDCGNLD
jgi:hypothetical protein